MLKATTQIQLSCLSDSRTEALYHYAGTSRIYTAFLDPDSGRIWSCRTVLHSLILLNHIHIPYCLPFTGFPPPNLHICNRYEYHHWLFVSCSQQGHCHRGNSSFCLTLREDLTTFKDMVSLYAHNCMVVEWSFSSHSCRTMTCPYFSNRVQRISTITQTVSLGSALTNDPKGAMNLSLVHLD